MVDFVKLLEEIANDPLGIGYSGAANDDALVVLLNADVIGSAYQRTFIGREECLSLMDMTEFAALTDGKKNLWLTLIANGVNPFGNEVEIAKDIWGTGSITAGNFNTARTQDISRVETLFGYGTVVGVGDVLNARAEGAQRGVVI